MTKNMLFSCNVFSPADPEILGEDTNKMSQSLNISFIHIFYISGFNFLDLQIKLLKMVLL